ncbi:DedA family protein [soil metagenome]
MSDLLHQAVDLIRNAEPTLRTFAENYGPWIYALAFAIVFAETGVVLLPFLPGDSLLFILGAFAAGGTLNLWLLLALLVVAAIAGDAVNYHIGRAVGPRIFRGEGSGFWARTLSRKHLDRAHAFYEKYGGKAVVLGRFIPIVRTFVPFVAGAGAMQYRRFVVYNIIGALAWVGVCTLAGYWFGNMPVVKKNFELVVIGIIIVSLLPVVIEFILARRRGAVAASPPSSSTGARP